MAYSFAQRYIAFVIQLALAMVMARLLSPEETGLYALAAAAVSIAGMLRDFGVSEYVIQERDLTRDGLRSAVGLAMIISWTIAFILFLIAHPLANFYKNDGILNVIYVLVLNFVFLPIGTMTFALLSKEMAFKSIFWIQTITTLLGAIVCVTLAYYGFSYMSMAWSSLFSICITILILAILRPSDIFLLPKFTNIGKAAKFGGTLTIGRMADQVCRRAPDFLIGNFLGFHSVGIYSKAATLLDAFQDFFASAVGRVALPAFAKEKLGFEQKQVQYIKSIRLISIFPILFFGFAILFAEPIIYFMFGAKWLEAVPIIKIASIGAILGSPYMLAWQVLTANGQVRQLLRIQVIGALLYLPAIYLGSQYSLVVMTFVGTLFSMPKLFLIQRALTSGLKIGFVDVFRNAIPSFLMGGAILLVSAPSLYFFRDTTTGAFLALMSGVMSTALATLILVVFFKHPLAPELGIIMKNLREKFGKLGALRK